MNSVNSVNAQNQNQTSTPNSQNDTMATINDNPQTTIANQTTVPVEQTTVTVNQHLSQWKVNLKFNHYKTRLYLLKLEIYLI